MIRRAIKNTNINFQILVLWNQLEASALSVRKVCMSNHLSNVYVYKNHFDTENAVRLLGNSGFDLKQLSVIGKGYHTEEHPIGFYTKGDRIRSWGKFGAFWGAIWGLLFTPAVFILPGLGLTAMAGPVVSALLSSLEGAILGAGISALGCALLELGIQHEQVIKYEVAIKAEKFLLLVHGSVADIERAHSVLDGPRKLLSFDSQISGEKC